MQRVFIDGSLGIGATTSRTIITTANLRTNHSAAVQFLTVASTQPLSVKIRSIDNDIDLSGEMFVGETDLVNTIILPQGLVPWFVGPQGDGLEVFLTSEAASSLRYNVMVGVAQFNNNVLEERTEQEEI